MITVGIDLAAEPATTAVARLEWSGGRCRVIDVRRPADDATVIAACSGADKIGIDSPLGWPESFVAFVAQHRDGKVTPPRDDASGIEWRRPLVKRLTDTVVQTEFGLRPLSVSADLIAHPAMRAAGLLARLAGEGPRLDRTGAGLVVEAYPAASLRVWGFEHRKYKGAANVGKLGEIVATLIARADWLDLGEHRAELTSSDHAFDAVIAALTARAAALGKTREPTPTEAAVATYEGWIGVPTCDFADLP